MDKPSATDVRKFVQAGKVKEVVGSIVAPEHARLAIIFMPVSVSGEYTHPVLDKVIKRWSKVKQDYREKFVNREKFQLGETITTCVASDIWVMSGLCLTPKNKLDKDAFAKCLQKLIATAKYERAFVHMSAETLQDFPAIKKVMAVDVPAEGLNLYVYNEPEELVKR